MTNLDWTHDNANSMEPEKRECICGPIQQAILPISENATLDLRDTDSLVMSVILGVKGMFQQLQ